MTTALLHSPARHLRSSAALADSRVAIDVRDRQIRITSNGVFAGVSSSAIPAAMAPLHRIGVTVLCSAVSLDLTGVTYLDRAALTEISATVLKLCAGGWLVTVLPPQCLEGQPPRSAQSPPPVAPCVVL